ncbi:TetR family transcriptional regulator [Pseudomonas sp. GD03842]|uniref:TetR family transcriptional regulator n=1 Tax=unclassified Pseudomonas TaxID=196821 RepID=UPI000D3AB522|nr:MULTISPECIES: TetR family transcriptional regulator [unclassified Pseudomonas]MDH0747621.1 TetR family transcriptional regulator [Pseudomonas sp. GD03842]RAU49342.1 TetR/AcrR family transcriptional regulator [Pseudomonas sp. RIT 409]RAU55917.1 TetR/AcrR family transcriptional regulator [Pseudomonas sp. RIT 412]
MNDARNPAISLRKRPKQARSEASIGVILEAATQVLAKEGARRFTTARVAEKAGVSIGSLYQYFPNKAAILFRLQSDEWQQTFDMLNSLLGDTSVPPLQRLRQFVHAFIRSECEEADMRTALDDAAPLYRHAPEARAIKEQGEAAIRSFIRETLPDTDDAVRIRAADLLTGTFTTVGKAFSQTPRTPTEVEAYSDAMADMFCAYLERLAQDRRQSSP